MQVTWADLWRASVTTWSCNCGICTFVSRCTSERMPCCFLKNITNIIADLAVQRTTPPLLVVHLSRVVCTWLPWKYRAQVLVNTKGWCFDVGNVGNKMIQWDDIRWTMTHAWMILMWRIHVDLNWQPSSRFLPTPGSDWQPSFIERSDRKQLFKLLRLRTCRFQSCSVF